MDGEDLTIERTANAERMARALDDLEAAKRRVEREATRSLDALRDKLVLDLLPVLDNVDRTIVAAEQAGDAPAVLDGARLVRRQLLGVLEGYGVQRVEAFGERFDPRRHEAISVVAVADPRDDRIVLDQLEPGYAMGERLLRPAKVVVGRMQYH